MRSMQPARLVLVLLAGLLLAAFVGNIVRSSGGGSASMTYGQLVQQVESAPQTIDKVVFKPRGQEVDVQLADGSSAKLNYPTAEAQIQLQNALEEENIAF